MKHVPQHQYSHSEINNHHGEEQVDTLFVSAIGDAQQNQVMRPSGKSGTAREEAKASFSKAGGSYTLCYTTTPRDYSDGAARTLPAGY